MRRLAGMCLVALVGCRSPNRGAKTEVATAKKSAILVEEGLLTRGEDDADRRDESPRHRVHVDAFRMDTTLVTRSEFLAFATRTGYRTDAEKAGFGVGSTEGMADWEWARMEGASFRRPFAEDATELERTAFLHPDAPAVMISFFDAQAYCADAGGRLPSEAEWEWAMRAERVGARYPWGEEPTVDGRYRLNFWQGASHAKNDRLDGFVYVSPVRAFSPTKRGLYDPVGNVWQWTADRYDQDTYARFARGESLAVGTEHDKRVLRGGSFWCGACTCEGNGLAYRGKAAPDAAFSNNGFRCVYPVRLSP